MLSLQALVVRQTVLEMAAEYAEAALIPHTQVARLMALRRSGDGSAEMHQPLLLPVTGQVERELMYVLI